MSKPPSVGEVYRHARLRGRWRVEKVGRRWITLRSLEVVSQRGYFSEHRVAIVNWPGEWA
jgi:hypothetical protein